VILGDPEICPVQIMKVMAINRFSYPILIQCSSALISRKCKRTYTAKVLQMIFAKCKVQERTWATRFDLCSRSIFEHLIFSHFPPSQSIDVGGKYEKGKPAQPWFQSSTPSQGESAACTCCSKVDLSGGTAQRTPARGFPIPRLFSWSAVLHSSCPQRKESKH
jgi:hypothetical protein